jgi:Transposase
VGGCRVAGERSGLAGGSRKRGLQARFGAEITQEIEALVGRGSVDRLDFETLEMAAQSQARAVAARAVEQRLNADSSDYLGPRAPCACGRAARYVGRRGKRFVTVLGDLLLGRAYYHCRLCRAGFAPRDQALGLGPTSLSPAVTRMVGLVGALVSFEEGSELLAGLAGLRIQAKQVERSAEALGAEISAQEQAGLEPATSPPGARTLYLGLDGSGIPMRASELRGRAGKQPDGSAKTREVKLCTIWSAQARDPQGHPQRDPGSVTYSAAIESAALTDTDPGISPFAQRVLREANRRGFQQAQRQVVLADGAPWIWNLADEHFPHAIQILDRFHVKQHLSDAAKAIWGTDPGTELGQQWLHHRYNELDAGQIDDLIDAYARHAPNCTEARLCADYLRNHRHRIQYPDFQDQGLCTSTGVLEAGCRVAVAQRLKRSGMRWTVRGANAILALRCAKLSARYDSFWKQRGTLPNRRAA